MNRYKFAALAIVVLFLSSNRASAQYFVPYGGYGSGMVSPYLNLLQNANGFTGNSGLPIYQTIVQPQIEAQRAAQQNRAGINQLQGVLNSGAGGRRGPSYGRNFFNYSHYYVDKH